MQIFGSIINSYVYYPVESMKNKLYNFILIWIIIVFVGLCISIFLITNELSEKRGLLWMLMFIVSNIAMIYFAYHSHTELTTYSKKNFPKFYYKYLFSEYWNIEKWPIFLTIITTFDKEIEDRRLFELKDYYNAVRTFQLFQGIFLLVLIVLFDTIEL